MLTNEDYVIAGVGIVAAGAIAYALFHKPSVSTQQTTPSGVTATASQCPSELLETWSVVNQPGLTTLQNTAQGIVSGRITLQSMGETFTIPSGCPVSVITVQSSVTGGQYLWLITGDPVAVVNKYGQAENIPGAVYANTLATYKMP